MLTKIVLVWAFCVLITRAVLDWLAVYWIDIVYITLLAFLLLVFFVQLAHIPAPCYLQPNDSEQPIVRI